MTDTLEKTRTYQQFIGGEWVDSASGQTLAVENPANGEVIAQVQASGPEDVDRAVKAAGKAFQTWQHTTPPSAACPAQAGRCGRGRADELGRLESRNAGKPVGAAIDEIPVMVDNLRFFAGAARVMEGKAANEYMAGHTSMIRREPVGVVASIAPWNYPLIMAGWKLGPALAAGNTVVLKPSARTPLTAAGLRRDRRRNPAARRRSTSSPARAPRSATRSSAIRGVGMISVTGDTDTGKHIARIAADSVKRLHLELGGKAPIIVFDDADLDLVAETIARPATGTPARTARRVPCHRRARGSTTASCPSSPTRSGRSSGATRPRATTSRWARSSPGPGRQGRGHGRRARAGRRGRDRRPSPGPGRRLLRADGHRRTGPEAARSSRTRSSGRWSRSSVSATRTRRSPGRTTSASAWPHRSGTSDVGKAMRVAKALEFGTVWINEHFSSPRRCRTAASRSPATARTDRCTRSRTTRSSST